jgi:glycosyltransferase involved in cell wall biosynthesis
MGGAERVAESLSVGLVAHGHEVTFVPVAGATDPDLADRMQGDLARHGVRVVAGGSATSPRIAALQAAARLARMVERTPTDVVHLHTEIPEFTWALAALLPGTRARRVRVVRTIHNTVLWGGWGRAGRFAEGRLDGARVASVSHAASAAFAAWRANAGRAPIETTVIYNGIDVSDLPDRPGEPNDPPVLAFAGRYEPQKGVDVLIDGLASVVDRGRPVRIVFRGSGSLAQAVADAADRWPAIVSAGPPLPDLRARLDTFDAILMPSRFEGMPLLAVEALAAGTPLIATDAPGLSEVLPDSYPGRCSPGDPAAYATLIGDFLTDPSAWREAALRAQDDTRRRFSLEAMVGAYVDLYAAAVS